MIKITKRKMKDAVIIKPSELYHVSVERIDMNILNNSNTSVYFKSDKRPIQGWMT